MSVAAVPWPAVTYEPIPWESGDAPTASRRDRRRHRGPYDAAVVPAIAQTSPAFPSDVTAAAEEAVAEISRFDAELGSEIAPFAAVLLRSESAASSRIENLTASARAIAEAELHEGSRVNASIVVANQRAMTAAIELADQLDGDAILAMHAALLGASDPEIAGRWREQQVWIGGSNIGPHSAVFVPPHHDRVQEAVEDLVAFMDRDDLPVMVHVAVAHAQFETIHPFPDGNGRVGRALVHAMLHSKGTTRNVTVPISAGLLVDVDRYFAALTAYRQGDPTGIVAAFTDATFSAVSNGRQLAEELRSIRAGWGESVTARRGANAWRLADLFVRQPVLDATTIATELGIPVQHVSRVIAPLEAASVVVESSGRRRNRLWRAPEVLAALDRFAARAGRRAAP